MTTAVAIVLAAGEGRRMGGPKAFLVVDAQPLLRSHVQRFLEVGCVRVVVVVRTAFADRARGLLGKAPEVELVATDTASMAESLTSALTCIPQGSAERLIVAPVDTLPVRVSTLTALLEAASSFAVDVATPSYLGQSGHPIVARETLLGRFRDGYAGTLRSLIRSAGARRQRVDVMDPAVVGDLDTPKDLAALREGLTPDFAG